MNCCHSIGVDAGEDDPVRCILFADHSGPHVGIIQGSDFEDDISRPVNARIIWQAE